MSKKKFLAGWLSVTALLLVGALLVPSPGGKEDIRTAMRDAVLHGENHISLFGVKEVNPAFISAMVVAGVLLLAAVLVRLLVIPRFSLVPGRFQLLLETLVSTFDGLARGNSPHRNGFLGAYVFSAGVYIFVGTLF